MAKGAIPAAMLWPAGQALPNDECVLWKTDMPAGSLPRGAAFDGEIAPDGQLSQYVYIGLFTNKEVWRLDPKTGAVVTKINVAPAAPYGLVIDKQSNVWAAGRENGGSSAVMRIETKNGDKLTNFPGSSCNYGITADARGYIYTSGYDAGCVARLDPSTAKWETLAVAGMAAGNGRGIAIDQNNHWSGGALVVVQTGDLLDRGEPAAEREISVAIAGVREQVLRDLEALK